MLKYLEDKFNGHPEKMVLLQRHALPDVSTEDENDSIVAPIEEENK